LWRIYVIGIATRTVQHHGYRRCMDNVAGRELRVYFATSIRSVVFLINDEDVQNG
jgi:hypothetical protein